MIRVYDAKSMRSDAQAWVTCDCEHWKFVCEVAAARVGSSTVIHAKNAPPRIKNPAMIPQLCKHLYAATALPIKPEVVRARKRRYRPRLR